MSIIKQSSIAATQGMDVLLYSFKKSEGRNDIYFDTFPKEIEEEKIILQEVHEAWQNRNFERMFQLMKVRTAFKV